MPFKSEKQRKAIFAAAGGKGRLGIPKKVAKKFIREEKKKRKHKAKLRGR